MRFLIIILLVMVCITESPAQTVLTGKIKDQTSGQPIEYATVSLLKEGKVIEGGSTDSTGQYKISDIPAGIYSIKAEFLGYDADTTGTIIVAPAISHQEIPGIALKPSRQTLQEVTIAANAPIVENKIDKVVYNAANDLTAQGGIALDVLKKVPQVSVDADGTVELQGNSNIRFLINGKPSGIFGSSLTDALSAIPASQIKSIEAITSPGAKYDAQGTGGIINIILKDSKMKGINGSVNASAGTRLENGSFNLNARKGDIGVHAFVSGNGQLNSKSLNSQNRLSYDATDNTNTRLLQDGYSDMVRKGYQAGLSFDWSPSKMDFLTGGFQYNYFGNQKEGTTDQQQTTTDASGNNIATQDNARYSLSKFHISSLDWNLDYKKKFRREGQSLEIAYNSSFAMPVTSYEQSQTNVGESLPYTGSSSYNPGKDQQTNISLDYAQPLAKDISLETGLKTSLQHINSISDQSIFQPSMNDYLFDPTQSYNMNYDMHVFAGYIASSINTWDWLHIKAGLRLEHTDVALDYAQTHIPSYNTLSPSLILSHNFNEQQSLKLSYTRRLERPDYDALNPFVNLSDPYNITTGNPLLKPEIGNNMELGYSRTFEGGANFYAALTERINTSDVKPFTAFYDDYTVGDSVYHNVSVSNKQNVGEEYNSGLILSGSLPVNNLSLRSNMMLFQRHMVNHLDGAAPVTDAYSFRININASYKLPFDMMAEAFGNYRSATQNIQGRQPQFFTYTFAFRKLLFHKNASIGITATNIFGNYVTQVSTIQSTDYTSYASRSMPFRSGGITFSYKFGKLEFEKHTKNEGDDPHNLPSEN